ncbi:MAG TPA: nucleotidyltransferase domain-containing protein [Sedimentisphaerales bacterium]|nr:nucleotidyltransferase domain-containing protein [Sedimentisphaerales bacterium]
MIKLFEENLDEIRAICSRYFVKRLEVFGSAVTGQFHESSDIDFLVEFQPLRPGQHADAYFGLLEAIKEVLGRDVDLVMTSAIKNPYFLQQISQRRELLYAA